VRAVAGRGERGRGHIEGIWRGSRLLDGYDTSGTGKERVAPTSGMELKTWAAQLLVEGGAGWGCTS
jgi:hypothetical protein